MEDFVVQFSQLKESRCLLLLQLLDHICAEPQPQIRASNFNQLHSDGLPRIVVTLGTIRHFIIINESFHLKLLCETTLSGLHKGNGGLLPPAGRLNPLP